MSSRGNIWRPSLLTVKISQNRKLTSDPSAWSDAEPLSFPGPSWKTLTLLDAENMFHARIVHRSGAAPVFCLQSLSSKLTPSTIKSCFIELPQETNSATSPPQE
jgi:hypothetical protein